jgi:hypothetical protein
VIPNGVKVIEHDAFSDLPTLERVVIPNTVVAIGDSAFCRCGIKEITIPESVTKIGGYCFGSTTLSKITVLGVPDIIYKGITFSGDLCKLFGESGFFSSPKNYIDVYINKPGIKTFGIDVVREGILRYHYLNPEYDKNGNPNGLRQRYCIYCGGELKSKWNRYFCKSCGNENY